MSASTNKDVCRLRRYHLTIHLSDGVKTMLTDFFDQIPTIELSYDAAVQMLEDSRGIIPVPSKNDLLLSLEDILEIHEIGDGSGNPGGLIGKCLFQVVHLDDNLDFFYLLSKEGQVLSTWAKLKPVRQFDPPDPDRYYHPEVRNPRS